LTLNLKRSIKVVINASFNFKQVIELMRGPIYNLYTQVIVIEIVKFQDNPRTQYKDEGIELLYEKKDPLLLKGLKKMDEMEKLRKRQ